MSDLVAASSSMLMRDPELTISPTVSSDGGTYCVRNFGTIALAVSTSASTLCNVGHMVLVPLPVPLNRAAHCTEI
jgi:hypothetical protein